MYKIFFIWLQAVNLILASVIFLAVLCQATLELPGRFCPDQDIIFKNRLDRLYSVFAAYPE